MPSTVVARPRLLEVLDRADAEASACAALVCAPAGYGKTTLLASHAQRLRNADKLVGWLSCDRRDTDATLLWRAVLAALSAAMRRSGGRDGRGDPFSALTPPPTVEPAFLAELVEAIADVGSTITLVLDDFQAITDPKTLSGVADFLTNLPERLHLIIGSRRDPSIPLHRLRLDGRLREVRGEDLAFGRDEVVEVLRRQDVELDDAGLTTLLRRTEGWPAAVRLASLALMREPDPTGFVARFGGEHGTVAAYLVAEILDRQPAAVQQFLLDTCVADELTAELAATLSGRSDAGGLLDQMSQANALVQRLGRSGEWFRYHTLLRSYLLAELRRRDLTALRERHRRAAGWFDRADMAAPALEHAVAAADETRIESMLSRHGLPLMLTGRRSLVMQAIDASPPAVREAPAVLLLTAIVAFNSGDRVHGDHLLKRLPALPDAGRGRWLADVARLYQARLHGDTGVLSVLAAEPDPQPGRPLDDDLELLKLANRGALRIAAGDYQQAKADLRAALQLSRRRGYHHLTLDCMNQLTGVTVGLSEINESSEWAGRTARFAAEHGWANAPQLAYCYVVAAWWAHLRLDPREATRQSARSIAMLAGGAIEPESEYAARSGAAVIAFDRYPQRRSALRDLDAIWQQDFDAVPSPALTAFALGAEMRMCLTLGDRGRAATVISRAEELLPGWADPVVVRAMELLDHHHHDRARALVAPVLAGELPHAVVTTPITAWLIEALAREHAGMVEATHRALLAALEIGEEPAVMRPFYDLGQPVRALLLGAVGRVGHLDPFLARLISAWKEAEAWQEAAGGSVAPAERARRHGATLVTPLTVREIEVQRDLPSLLTIEEIAEQHQVSVNTVKTHLRSLYRKLGARNRRAAVAAAHRLNLL